MQSIELLNQGLFLEDFNILIDWNITSQEFITKYNKYVIDINEKNDFNYIGYCVKSNVLSLPYKFLISFDFIKNKLKSIYFSMGEQAQFCFEASKNNLSKVLGEPRKKKNLFSKQGEISFQWRLKKILIKLEMVERFGMQEYLYIEVL